MIPNCGIAAMVTRAIAAILHQRISASPCFGLLTKTT
jgi:hypothetical protein